MRTSSAGAQRIAVIALASVLGGMTAGVAVIGSEAFEVPLTDAAQAALHDARLTGVSVRFDGREAVLTGDAADAAVLAEAARVVGRVDGVRWVSLPETHGLAPAPTPTPSPAPEEDPRRDAAVAELESTTIRFAPDSTALDDAGLRRVARVAVLLTQFPELRVRLTGHVAIATGTTADAIAFSTRRAQAVVDELVAAGVDPGRLGIAGAGATGVDAADGRRVDLEIVEEG